VQTQERSKPGAVQNFIELTQTYRQDLETIAPKLIDGKRALNLKAVHQVSLKKGG
jgi:hypothetical protein